jgi:hypothetical protein
MSDHVPQPKYSLEHREQAKQENRPLFTLDIYHYPRKRRSTCTGVATDSEIDDMIARLQRIKEQR